MTVSNFTYKELQQLYSENFSLGYINADINSKFALLSLVCFVTYTDRKKNPDSTPYSILKRILKDDFSIPDAFIWSIAIHCDDLMYGCTEFPTFGIEPKNIIPTIKDLIGKYLPF